MLSAWLLTEILCRLSIWISFCYMTCLMCSRLSRTLWSHVLFVIKPSIWFNWPDTSDRMLPSSSGFISHVHLWNSLYITFVNQKRTGKWLNLISYLPVVITAKTCSWPPPPFPSKCGDWSGHILTICRHFRFKFLKTSMQWFPLISLSHLAGGFRVICYY